ncbi:MAG: NUDIX hydrolase [Propionibacteriaceae bacterium]|nr:NUDIX hydrolase [Propionibacteriaceae bacterium]
MSMGDKPLRWEVRGRDVLGVGAISNFVDDEVVTPSGETVQRQYLTHPGAVSMVVWDEEADTIACLHQYRHPVGMELLEIPAGLLDGDHEVWLDAAQRELAEEVELAASRWQVLVDICPTAGACQESQRIYLARGLTPTQRPEGFVLEGEEAEMSWEWIDRATLLEAVLDGRCQSQALVTGMLALETCRLSGRLDTLRGADAPWPIRSRPRP